VKVVKSVRLRGAAIGHAQLDYPLMLPLSVLRAWMYAGVDTIVAPGLLAWLFTAAIISGERLMSIPLSTDSGMQAFALVADVLLASGGHARDSSCRQARKCCRSSTEPLGCRRTSAKHS